MPANRQVRRRDACGGGSSPARIQAGGGRAIAFRGMAGDAMAGAQAEGRKRRGPSLGGALLAGTALLCLGLLLVSGNQDADPATPPALPGAPPPFLGTAVVGGGGLTAAIDAYGDVVDMRAASGGSALIDNPLDRQRAGTVSASAGIVP